MTVPVIKTPYLVTSREFPQEPDLLQNTLIKSYTDTSLAVNARTIGIYDKFEIVTGNKYFNPQDALNRRQSYRRLYTFENFTNASNPNVITHEIANIDYLTILYGTCVTSIPDFRPIPYASITLDANIEINATDTQIIINVGSASPNLVSGLIIIEYVLKTT